MKHTLFYFLLLILASCSSKEEINSVVDGEYFIPKVEIRNLNGKNVGPKGVINLVTSLNIVGEDIIFIEQKPTKLNSIFNVYSSSDFTLKYEGGSLGEDPGSIKNPEFIKLVGYSKNRNEVTYFDFTVPGINTINLESNKISPYVDLTEAGGGIQVVARMNDSTVVYSGLDNEAQLVIRNIVSGNEIEIPFENYFDISDSSRNAYIYNPRSIAFLPDHNIIAGANTTNNSMMYYDLDQQNLNYILIGENENIQDGMLDRSVSYYTTIKSINNGFYGHFAGFSGFQQTVLSNIALLKTEVHLYDVETKELTIFKLDRLTNDCIVNEELKYILCIDEGNESQPLVKYEI